MEHFESLVWLDTVRKSARSFESSGVVEIIMCKCVRPEHVIFSYSNIWPCHQVTTATVLISTRAKFNCLSESGLRACVYMYGHAQDQISKPHHSR